MKPLQMVLRYAQKYRLELLLAVISMLSLVGVQLFIPWIIRELISAVTSAVDYEQSSKLIMRLTLIVLIVFTFRGIFQFLRSYMAHVAGWGVVADVRRHLYDHLQRLTLRFYEDKQTGQLMSQVVNDSDLFEMLIAHAIPDVIVNVLTLVGVSVVLFFLNAKLLLLSLVPIPFLIISLRIYARFVRPAFRQRQKELGDLNATLNDNISGIREIKAFTREDVENLRIGKRIEGYRNSLLRALRLMATFQPFVDFASSMGTLVVIYFGGRLAFDRILPISDLVAFFLYLEMFYQPIRSLSGAWESLQSALAGADRVGELLAEEPEKNHHEKTTILSHRTLGGIRFENVKFQYSQGEQVLDTINLDIPPRHVVALVGPTGVGKSTLVSLIPRFYEVSEGRITLDGQDIRTIELSSLRQQISMVLQDVFLFHGSVRENILFGRPGATESEMIEAARIANAHDFIKDLPQGYDTLIGERGVKLSGGQKQRLSIARAVLKDAPILILDEATSSVDTQTEILIQEALERLMTGRTTIIIAHRLSTIRNANQIVVLEGRQVKEIGTHVELMERRGLYWKLSTAQYEAYLHPNLARAEIL
jgi:ATP-binding cassette subfamily B protein/subfamily B ATP-binding cassette protein MsbA